MSQRRWFLSGVLVVTMSFAGCGDDNSTGADAGQDLKVDLQADVKTDQKTDVAGSGGTVDGAPGDASDMDGSFGGTGGAGGAGVGGATGSGGAIVGSGGAAGSGSGGSAGSGGSIGSGGSGSGGSGSGGSGSGGSGSGGSGSGGSGSGGSGSGGSGSGGATCTFTGGAVTSDVTLTKACSPYTINTDISVTDNATLTVEAGVTLKFEAGRGLNVPVGYARKVVIQGTPSETVVLTSAAATPAAGDWKGIDVSYGAAAATRVSYARIEYAGPTSQGAALVVQGPTLPGTVTLDHVTIDHSASNGMVIKHEDAMAVITDCTFLNTASGYYAIESPLFALPGIASTNTWNGARVLVPGGEVSRDLTLSSIGTEIVMSGPIRIVDWSTPTVTIGPGMKFLFEPSTYIDVGDAFSGGPGNLVVNGTPGAPVVFTSAAASPAAGDWHGIWLAEASTLSLSYAEVSYAGQSDHFTGNIVVQEFVAPTGLTVRNSTISNSRGWGIYIDCDATLTSPALVLENNTYANNASGDVGPTNCTAVYF